VEDVDNLCERLSILADGEVVAEGTPDELREPLKGRLWTRLIPRTESPPSDALHIAAAPAGIRVVVEGDGPPEPDYQPHAPRLEDVHHHALGGSKVAA